jgi:hypothetical protein
VAHRRRRAGFLRVLSHRVGAAQPCPDDAELAAFLDRQLTEARARAFEEHFDQCQVCRELAFLLAGLDPRLETGDP